MIYIVEIPHQRPASCWSAIDENDAMDRINQDLAGRHMAEEASDYDEAIRLNGEDLYAQYVLTTQEAIEALANHGQDWSPHQRERSVSALRRAMLNAGDLEDDQS